MREMLNRLARSEEICYKEMKKTVFSEHVRGLMLTFVFYSKFIFG